MISDTIKVAIAHDNHEFVGIMQNFLSQHSDILLVGTANDGESILSIINEQRPDVVVLDIIMPRLDGIGVLERINEMNGHRPKVVVLTVFRRGRIMQQVMESGADYQLLMPCNFDVLLEKIRQLAGKVKPPKSAAITMFETLTMDQKVSDIIKELGFPVHRKGYYYTCDAIMLAIGDDHSVGPLNSKIYPLIAAKHNTTRMTVESDIRNCINIICSRGNTPFINRLFGPGKAELGITNKEFIATITELLKYRGIERVMSEELSAPQP